MPQVFVSCLGLLRVRLGNFLQREIPAKCFFKCKLYFMQKIVLFGNVFTQVKTLFGSENTSRVQILLGPSISSRLRDCVTVRVTRM